MREDFTEVEDYFVEEKTLLDSDASDVGSCLKSCYRYHYTAKIKTVEDILTSKCIWLTHCSEKNDSSEGRFILDSLANKSNNYRGLIDTLIANLYLTSFSLYGNRLSQWRGYGYLNIGFDFEGMKSDLRKIEDESGIEVVTSGALYSRCEYLSRDGECFENKVSDIENRIGETENSDPSSNQYQYLTIGADCFSIKHLGFSEECEYRIFSYLWRKKPFHDNGRRYLKLHFLPSRVRRIVIGPSLEQESKLKRIKEFLSSRNEYNHVELFRSTIPYLEGNANTKNDNEA